MSRRRKGNKVKMVFQTIEHRDGQLRAFETIAYSIDKKNPLIVWLYI